MSRTVTIVTPENITVTYNVAGFGSRFLSTGIDLLIQIALLLIMMFVFRVGTGVSAKASGGAGSLVSAIRVILFFVIVFFYATFFEMMWGGRTPGKRLMGLRVIRDGGYPITLMASLLRNILRFIDFGLVPISAAPVVLWGLPGLIAIFCSPQYKRLGDYAAGTLVIVESGATALNTQRAGGPPSPGAAYYLPLIRNVDRLTVEEYRMVRRFAARRGDWDLVVQASLGERLARPLLTKMEVDVPVTYQCQYADVIEAIERSYAEEFGVL